MHIQPCDHNVESPHISGWHGDMAATQKPFDVTVRHRSSSFKEYLPPCSNHGIMASIQICTSVVGQTKMSMPIITFKMNSYTQS